MLIYFSHRYNMQQQFSSKIAIVYMGGTFGCVGEPLAPLAADQFIQHLEQLDLAHHHCEFEFLVAPLIADSSAYTAGDWLQFILFLQKQAETKNLRKFVIIHGTDTLSYASAVLSRFFYQNETTVVLTGSQLPLLNSNTQGLRPNSDAFANLNFAIESALKHTAGVFLAFEKHCIAGNLAIKSHSTKFEAFHQQQRTVISSTHTPSYIIQAEDVDKIQRCNILNLTIQPLSLRHLTQHLTQILDAPPHFLILQGFGVGNLATNESILQCLEQLFQKGCLTILSTQVPFGAIQQDYAISDWVKSGHTCLDNTSSNADLYAKLLEFYLKYNDIEQRYQNWIQQ